MKIAYVVNHLEETGVNNVVRDLVLLFSKHGHECTLFYIKESAEKMNFDCEVYNIQDNFKLLYNNDIIHLHGLGPCLYSFLKKPLKGGGRVITTLHNYMFQDYTSLYGTVVGRLLGYVHLLTLRRVDKVITLSKDARCYYSKWIPNKKLTYAYNTRIIDNTLRLDDNELSELMNFKKDSILMGMNGVLIKRKGIDVILKAMEYLPSEFKLFLVGGTSKSIEEYKRTVPQSASDRIYFAGCHNKAYRYLPYYDLLLLPSRSEGFPLALLEAAAYGRNIVCSNLPILKECFTEDEVTFCKIGDTDSVVKAIKHSVSVPEKGKRVKVKFDDCYSPECFYNRHLMIYKGLLDH